ncbi:hypothetical protein [Vulcanisaeta souniana]|uniref:Uncharacterized protein n=1 Tax=Vulcanisaeta souniana JCM 11219 TaxID=1293586 RepID=A0A830E737_9CREN|nr:hypothetical protein [Vulcanisaeta souniana]BDR91885.1 hypothetical protein Vsou_09780 [Vulcanisaeta souniana JCM 11219]GGI69603.1 hypothetical protein GCM10007112_03240 [Vulcanisaeta souniana JCM 11219]
MALGLVGSGSSQYVEFTLPYLSSYKPFIAVYDARGVRIIDGGNAIRAQVFGNDYAVIKGYLANSRPYVMDIIINGDGVRFLPALFNQLVSKVSPGNVSGNAVLYILEFRVPNDVGISVRFHREIRQCFSKYAHTWIGHEVCFDLNKWKEIFSKYENAFIRAYPIYVSTNDALRIVDSIINSIRRRINYLSEDLRYELRGYRRTRLRNLITEFNELLNGWESFRASLVRNNASYQGRQ